MISDEAVTAFSHTYILETPERSGLPPRWSDIGDALYSASPKPTTTGLDS